MAAPTATAISGGPAGWLLEGDPAIRWQTMRDLMDAPQHAWEAEQARVAVTGWGAALLAHRDSTGRWTPRFYGKKWISTTYSMMLLRQLGLPGDDRRAQASCRLFLDEGSSDDGGIDPSVTRHRCDDCVTGMVLGLLSWFGVTDPRRERLVDCLLAAQLPDGGWNCERDRGATHSSLHTTLSVLEGLRDYAAGAVRRAGRHAPQRRRGGSSCSPTACSARTAPGRSSTRGCSGSRSRPDGATTCCAPWTTSGPPVHRRIRGCATRSTSSVPGGRPTAGGCCRPRTPAGRLQSRERWG